MGNSLNHTKILSKQKLNVDGAVNLYGLMYQTFNDLKYSNIDIIFLLKIEAASNSRHIAIINLSRR